MNNKFYTLITGASEGFGKSLALECARRNMNLILVSLPGAELHALAAFIRRNYHVDVFTIERDLCEDSGCSEVFAVVRDANLRVNMLINNAGLGSTLLFGEGTITLYEKQIKLNVLATTLMTRLFLEDLKQNSPAHILNVGSLASFFLLRKKLVYGATKSFVYAFTRSLRQELKKDKVYVSVLCPGGMCTNMTLTLMIKNAGYFTRLAVMNPEQAAPIALDGLLEKKAVIVPGRINQLMLFMDRIIPGFLKRMIMNNSINEMQTENRFSIYVPKSGFPLNSTQVS